LPQSSFPSSYRFYPESFNLPFDWDSFELIRSSGNGTFIVKPDNGSLGHGIEILEPWQPYSSHRSPLPKNPYLIENHKFDLRVYCLVASLRPSEVYVYRDGVAAFVRKKTVSERFSRKSQMSD
jgi:hypothetical protein